MAALVRTHRLAIREYLEAKSRYAAFDQKLALRFEEEIDRGVSRIADSPLSWPIALGSFRWVRTRRFPFVLYYHVEDEQNVLLLAVAHSRRRWGYWRRRLSY